MLAGLEGIAGVGITALLLSALAGCGGSDSAAPGGGGTVTPPPVTALPVEEWRSTPVGSDLNPYLSSELVTLSGQPFEPTSAITVSAIEPQYIHPFAYAPQFTLAPAADGFALAWNDLATPGVVVTLYQQQGGVWQAGNSRRFDGVWSAGFSDTEYGFALATVKRDMAFYHADFNPLNYGQELILHGLESDLQDRFQQVIIANSAGPLATDLVYGQKLSPLKFGSARLAFGNHTVALFAAHEANGAQAGEANNILLGDMLKLYNNSGGLIGRLDLGPFSGDGANGWNWNHSHSLDQRLLFDDKDFIFAALGDIYPRGLSVGKLGTEYRQTLPLTFIDADQNRTGAQLGGLTQRAGGGYLLGMTGSLGRNGGSDPLLLLLDGNAEGVKGIWLSQNGTNLAAMNLKMAAYGDHQLLIWELYNRADESWQTLFAIIDANGVVKHGPQAIDGYRLNRSDDLLTLANGDVIWIMGQPNQQLRVNRFRYEASLLN